MQGLMLNVHHSVWLLHKNANSSISFLHRIIFCDFVGKRKLEHKILNVSQRRKGNLVLRLLLPCRHKLS